MSLEQPKTSVTSPGAESRNRYEQVDVLRGLAALTVVFSHYLPFWDRYLGDIVVAVPGAYGYYAVNLFFVVSGLVIFMTLDRCKSVKEFAVLRFSRLYPAYWATLILATLVGVAVFRNELWTGGFLVNLTMLQEVFGYANFDNVYWSLTVELAFYLNVAWIFALGLHNKIIPFLAGWLLLSGLWAVAIYDPVNDTRDLFSLILVLDYAAFFSIGILFYSTRGRNWRRSELALLASAFLVQYLIASLEGLAVAVVSALLVFAAIHGRMSFLVNKFTLWLGTISYTLYLIHRNIAYELLPWLHDHGFGPVSGIAVTTLGILVLATGVTYLIEQPASRMIRSYWRNRAPNHSTSGGPT